MCNNLHKPVLLKESIEYLKVKSDGIYVDATIGTGGHAEEILKKLGSGLLIGIDCDISAIEISKKRLEKYKRKLKLFCSNFVDIRKILSDLKIQKLNGILFDLGTSSVQLSDPERGFSFLKDGPLDMRMDKNTRITAKAIVNTYPENELFRIFKEYGEEKWAKRVSKFIVDYRSKREIETTLQLSEIVLSAIPKKFHFQRIHPATRVFQALRIEVNDELNNIRVGLSEAMRILSACGRIVVISYHSLEDRIVKHFFRDHLDSLNTITKHPVQPGPDEIKENPSSRSAKLRVAEKL